jgi:hypothetical protein
MNGCVLEALIDCLAFLSLSDDDTVNPDAAVGALEQAAFILRKMPANEQSEFRDFLSDMVQSEATAKRGEEYRQFLRRLPAELGLTD